MAVSTYIENDRFILRSEIYAEIGDLFIFLLMRLPGIGQKQSVDNRGPGWIGAREFFTGKLPELETMKLQSDTTTERGCQYMAFLDEIIAL